MSKKGISISILIVIATMLFVRYLLSKVSLDDISIAERVTIYLQALAGSVTACISFWGLTIAHRKIKHWELEQCQKLWETYYANWYIKNEMVKKWNNDPSAFSLSEYTKILDAILILWEDIARKEQKSYLDKDILYDIFIFVLIDDLECGLFDHYQQKNVTNKLANCHTRKLYIKWKKRLQKEQYKKHLSDDWDEVQQLIKQAREKDPELAEIANRYRAFIEKKGK